MARIITITNAQHDICMSMLEAAKDQATADMNSETPDPESGVIYLMLSAIEHRFKYAVETAE